MALLFGCLLAIGTPRALPRWAANLLALAGVTVIITALAVFDPDATPWLPMLLACVGTACMLHATHQQTTLVGWCLQRPLLVNIGQISYSLYLWHWVLLSFFDFYLLRRLFWYESIIIIQIAFVLAFFTWRWIEQPFRTKRMGVYSDRNMLRLAILLPIGFAAAGFLLWKQHAWMDHSSYFMAPIKAHHAHFEQCHVTMGVELPEKEPCLLGKPSADGRYDTLLWGDSHADHYLHAMLPLANASGRTIRPLTHNGCMPYMPSNTKECGLFNAEVIDEIERNPNLSLVILGGKWDNASRAMESFTNGMHNTLRMLSERNIHVLILGQVPRFNDSPEKCATYMLRHEDPSRCIISREEQQKHHQRSHDFLEQLATTHPNVTIFQPDDVFCTDIECRMYDDGGFFYYNVDHLSLHGAETIRPALRETWNTLP